MQFLIKDIKEFKNIFNFLKNKLTKNSCLLLKGEMGAGKTTFTKKILEYMNIKELVTSPTFTILNQYQIKNFKINHIDAYRVTKHDEVEMYLEEMFDSLNIIEWYENLNINYSNYFKIINIDIKIVSENERIFLIEEKN